MLGVPFQGQYFCFMIGVYIRQDERKQDNCIDLINEELSCLPPVGQKSETEGQAKSTI